MAWWNPLKRRARKPGEEPEVERAPVEMSVAVSAPEGSGRSDVAFPCSFTIIPHIPIAEHTPAARSQVCLVFDCSTSMRGEKIEAAIDAARIIVDTLDPRHRLSLVTYATATRVFLENEAPTDEKRPELREIVEEVRSEVGGRTRLTLGIQRAMRIFRAAKDEGYAKTMIILSDGGADKPADAFKAAQRAADSGVQVFAVGIGEGYKAEQLLRLVKPSAGSVLDYRESNGLSAAFEVVLRRIESFVATNARLEISLSDDVKPGQAYRTSPDTMAMGKPKVTKGSVSFNMGNIEPNTRYGLLLDLKTRKSTTGRFATAVFTCEIPSLEEKEYRCECEVVVVGEESESDARARRSAEVADAADALTRATSSKQQREALERLIAVARKGTLRKRSEEALTQVQGRKKLDNAMLNAVLVAASHTPDATVEVEAPARRGREVKLYDVILVDVGPTPIALLRELRQITGDPLKEVHRLLERSEPVISRGQRHKDARALARRLKSRGAKAVVEATGAPRDRTPKREEPAGTAEAKRKRRRARRR